MAPQLSTPHEMAASPQPARKTPTVILAVAAVVAGVLVLGAFGLWFHYGMAVFFETIAAGISSCF